jgi:hypothetical protein
MKVYKQTAPSGITVTSNVPFPEPRWWDSPRRHIVWSYLSWATLIAAEHGWKQPKRLFRKYLSR